MHKELLPQPRKAVAIPSRGRLSVQGTRQVGPALFSGVVHVQVAEIVCGDDKTNSHDLAKYQNNCSNNLSTYHKLRNKQAPAAQVAVYNSIESEQ